MNAWLAKTDYNASQKSLYRVRMPEKCNLGYMVAIWSLYAIRQDDTSPGSPRSPSF
jgi:hypothetical protein